MSVCASYTAVICTRYVGRDYGVPRQCNQATAAMQLAEHSDSRIVPFHTRVQEDGFIEIESVRLVQLGVTPTMVEQI